MHYLIGDLQGCCDALERLLAQIDFSPSRDRLTVLGDLVNRGPQSLATLRRLRGLGDAATCLLGNHDLHLLAVACGGAHGAPQRHASPTCSTRPTATHWLDWLRQQRMARASSTAGCACTPAWCRSGTLAETLALRRRGRGACCAATALDDFLHVMYGNEPARWSAALQGDERLRFIINVLTRIRFVDAPTARST